MSDEVLAHNKRVMRRRAWALPLLYFGIFMVLLIILAGMHIDVSRNENYVHVIAWTFAALAMWQLFRLGAVAPRSAAALEWGQELLAQRRSGIRATAGIALSVALALPFASKPYADTLPPAVVYAALITCVLVMRSPRGDGAIVEDEFVKAMRARAVSLGFILMLASMTALACLAMLRPDWLTRAIVPALAIPVAAMGWRFVLLTQSSGRDG